MADPSEQVLAPVALANRIRMPRTATREPAGTSNVPAELTASTNTVPAPASAERCASSTTDCTASNRTPAITAGSPNDPSAVCSRTVIE